MAFELIIIALLILAFLGIRIVNEWEEGIVLTLGRYTRDAKPGLNIIIPFIERLIKVDKRITTVDIPKQEVMTKDNVSVMVNGVVYFRVEDAKKAILKIDSYRYAVAQYSLAALKDVIGETNLDELLVAREEISSKIKELVDKETEEWGVDITSIKIQDVELPQNMKRAMARQAEAERERRATILLSEGEFLASQNLVKAAKNLEKTPIAIHLRTLQTISDISGDPNSKIVIALPVEVLKAFERIGALEKEGKTKKSHNKQSTSKEI